MNTIDKIISEKKYSKTEIIELLQTTGEDRLSLWEKAQNTKLEVVGNKVYFRGLVEFSNICSKD